MATAKEKAKAAVAETNGKPKEIEWRGLTFALPERLPGTLLFDYENLQTNTGALKFISSIIGADQFAQVRAKVEEDGLDLEETEKAVIDSEDSLFALVARVYGTAPGESEASASS